MSYFARILPLNLVETAFEFPFSQNVKIISLGFIVTEFIVESFVSSKVKVLPDKAKLHELS